MNSGWGMNPTTRLFPSTTTMVDRMCVSFSSSRSILYPSSSVSSVTTSVSCRACVCTLHVFGSCPAATHSMTMSRSEIVRSEEHTSELQSQSNLVCRLLLEKKKQIHTRYHC